MKILMFSEVNFDIFGNKECLQGGPQLHMTNLVLQLVKDYDVTVHIVQNTSDESMDEKEERVRLGRWKGKIVFHYYYNFLIYPSLHIRRLIKLLNRFDIDFIHLHITDHQVFFLLALYAFKTGKGLVITNHDPLQESHFKLSIKKDIIKSHKILGHYIRKFNVFGITYLFLDLWLGVLYRILTPKKLNHIIHLLASKQVGANSSLTTLCGISPDCCKVFKGLRSMVIGNLVDTNFFSEKKIDDLKLQELKKQFGINHKRVIFCPSRIDPIKGQHYLIQISEQLEKLISDDVVFMLFNRNPFKDFPPTYGEIYAKFEAYDKRLTDELSALNEKEMLFRIKPVPHNEMLEWYHLSDVVIIPSISEGLCTCILEALSMGRPVIAFEVGGNQELIINGENGFLIKPFDTQEFSEKIAELLKNRKRAEQMGKRGRDLIRSKYDVKTITRIYMEEVYTPLLKKLQRL